MEIITTKNRLYQFLGITLFVQAISPLVAGLMFKSLGSEVNIEATMNNIAQHVMTVNISLVLHIITAAVIIMLGVAIYYAAGHINKTMATIALLLYVYEAILLAVSQCFIFGLLKVSQLYITNLDDGLLSLGTALFSSSDFAGKLAMIPFGIGAVIFYYLMMKAKIIPKWLALWGILTAPLILIGIPLLAFGVKVPIYLFAPYVPFEFFTGIYIIIKYRKKTV